MSETNVKGNNPQVPPAPPSNNPGVGGTGLGGTGTFDPGTSGRTIIALLEIMSTFNDIANMLEKQEYMQAQKQATMAQNLSNFNIDMGKKMLNEALSTGITQIIGGAATLGMGAFTAWQGRGATNETDADIEGAKNYQETVKNAEPTTNLSDMSDEQAATLKSEAKAKTSAAQEKVDSKSADHEQAKQDLVQAKARESSAVGEDNIAAAKEEVVRANETVKSTKEDLDSANEELSSAKANENRVERQLTRRDNQEYVKQRLQELKEKDNFSSKKEGSSTKFKAHDDEVIQDTTGKPMSDEQVINSLDEKELGELRDAMNNRVDALNAKRNTIISERGNTMNTRVNMAQAFGGVSSGTGTAIAGAYKQDQQDDQAQITAENVALSTSQQATSQFRQQADSKMGDVASVAQNMAAIQQTNNLAG